MGSLSPLIRRVGIGLNITESGDFKVKRPFPRQERRNLAAAHISCWAF